MATLSGCKNELRSIIQELEIIEWGIRHEFVGIGQEMAAECLVSVIEKYRAVLNILNNVNTNNLGDWVLGD